MTTMKSEWAERDFYEALVYQGKVLVAIGDVQGHSLHAATVMGELRHALRAFAVEGHSPVAITGLVNQVLTRYHPGIIATLCLVVLDPGSGELQIVNCGHMPPLLVGGPGATVLSERVDELSRTRSGALDVQANELRRIERHCFLPVRDRGVGIVALRLHDAERIERPHDRDRDERGDEAVFDRRGAALVAQETLEHRALLDFQTI